MATNFERAFEQRPDVYAAWQSLNGAIKSNMDLRRYELATFAAALRLGSSYCALAHGNILRTQLDEDPVAIATRHADAGLDAVDHAVMDLAERVAADAGAITDADLDQLRTLGLDDTEILDVVLAATARCFFSTTLDAMGVLPDAHYAELPEAMRETLVVGRPIATA